MLLINKKLSIIVTTAVITATLSAVSAQNIHADTTSINTKNTQINNEKTSNSQKSSTSAIAYPVDQVEEIGNNPSDKNIDSADHSEKSANQITSDVKEQASNNLTKTSNQTIDDISSNQTAHMQSESSEQNVKLEKKSETSQIQDGAQSVYKQPAHPAYRQSDMLNAKKIQISNFKVTVKSGWVTENGIRHYYENGKLVKGDKIINGNLYRFNANGTPVTGYLWQNGSFVYFDDQDGHALTGKRYYSGGMEYYGNDYRQVRNAYVATGNTYYYMKANGDAYLGLRTYGNNQLEYYGSNYEQVRNQEVKSGDDYYYMGLNGDAITGFYNQNNQFKYYAGDHKQLRSNYLATGNTYYYFDKNGQALKGQRYYSGGMEYYGNDYKQVRNAYVAAGNTYYYMKANGDAYLGLRTYGNNQLEYYGSDYKQLRNTSIILDNKIYYFNQVGDAWKIVDDNKKVNMDKAIHWFERNKGQLTYSMGGARNGSDGTADCSGSVTQALYEAGASRPSWLYNTEYIHDYLTANGFKLIVENNPSWNAERGDIVIWGKLGQSAGAFGHIGIITTTEDDPYFISTSYMTHGQKNTAVQEVRYNEYAKRVGYPYYYVYRQA